MIHQVECMRLVNDVINDESYEVLIQVILDRMIVLLFPHHSSRSPPPPSTVFKKYKYLLQYPLPRLFRTLTLNI